jgi:hypothetical protein
MSVNWALAVGAVFVASMGTIAGACKRSGAKGTQETSATPNNNVPDNAVSAFPDGKSSRDLGTALCAA